MTLHASPAPRNPSETVIDAMTRAESAVYVNQRPKSQAAAGRAASGFLNGVPLHWMRDWPQPFPMIAESAKGNQIRDIDGNTVTDFCLGDTASMFGHAPAPVMRALAARAEGGLSFMLPSDDAARVGELLVEHFRLPLWQMAVTASDANRFALRAARAATKRDTVLVFEGCYHGTVEDTLVDLVDGRTVSRRSLLGQVKSASVNTIAVPFNDIAALDAALAPGAIACVIAEPVMTNCSMILPEPGFLEHLRAATRKAGTLLIIDETHTISSGPGGYAATHNLEPDLLVLGKPIAGGVPAAVWGMTQAVADALFAARAADEHGHSGIGTTLAGNALQLACIRAVLEEVMTTVTYQCMHRAAEALEAGISAAIARYHLAWHVARVGARLEIVFSDRPLRNARDAIAAEDDRLQGLLHTAMLNRGFLLTPFHNMMLVCPDTTDAQVESFLSAFDEVLASLTQAEAA